MGSYTLHKDVSRKLAGKAEEEGFDALLILGNENLYYVSGAYLTTGLRIYAPIAAALVHGDNMYMVVPEDEHSRVVDESPAAKLAEIETYNPLTEDFFRVLANRVNALGFRRLGVDAEFLPYTAVQRIRGLLDAEVEDASSLIWKARMVKHPEEVEYIAKASEILVQGIKRAMEKVRPGVSEVEIAAEIEYWTRRMGATYTPIINLVASGKRLVHSHPHSTSKKLEPGELVMLDAATSYEYYCSDMTRFVSLGPLSDTDRRGFDFIEELLGRLIDLSVEGNTASSLWEAAKSIYEKHGYSRYLNHVVGRGIGIEVVEPPVISAGAGDVVLRENMVLAFNPSLHIGGLGGWRLEDVVVVGKRKARILTEMPWDVVVV